jgi:hypothetical protein
MSLNFDPRFTQVRERILEIEKEFPDFFIGLWCPEDFVAALGNAELDAPLNDEELHEFSCAMVEQLHDNHDATIGVNWQVLEWTAIDITREKESK